MRRDEGAAFEPPDFGRRMPELDGLRGLAILLVLYYHYFASAALPAALSAAGKLTWSGVDLFFVLSGFLVGGILIDARDSRNFFKTFYARRAYRILPLYALTCAAFLILSNTLAYKSNTSFAWLFANPLPWQSYATLTQNFWMTATGTLGPAWLGATWSLAVEEQFYLTLPFVIRYTRRERLPYVLAVFVVAAPVARALFRLFYAHGDMASFVLMPCRADALMLGVAAALFMREPRVWRALVTRKRLLYAAQLILLCGMAWMSVRATGDVAAPTALVLEGAAPSMTQTEGVTTIERNVAPPHARGADSTALSLPHAARVVLSSLNYTWIALFYLCLLTIAVTQRESFIARLLRARLLMSVGVLAYAAYLFHQPVQGLCYGLLRGTLPQIRDAADFGVTLLALVVTLALARASWVFFERPLLRRGHRHVYEAGAQQASKLPAASTVWARREDA